MEEFNYGLFTFATLRTGNTQIITKKIEPRHSGNQKGKLFMKNYLRYEYVFSLVSADVRAKLNVRRFRRYIRRAVRRVFRDADVDVFSNGWSMIISEPLEDGVIRKIGASYCKSPLGKWVKEYFYGEDETRRSGQLFRRVKELCVIHDDNE